MVPKWLMALLLLLREAWSARRDAHIRLLKLQVELLKDRLPGNRVVVDPVERRRLMKIGAEIDHAVEDTLGIVNIKTYPCARLHKLRDELLNRELFLSLAEARYALDEWRLEYDHRRPHGGIGWQTPAAFAGATLAGPPVGAAPLPASQPTNQQPILS